MPFLYSISFFRLSIWHEKAFGYVLPVTELARCKEKVAQDFVFVDMRFLDETIEYSILERKYGFVDMLGILGKFRNT